MRAKDLKLKVVNETEEGKIEFLEFSPYMEYDDFIGSILGDAVILRPTGEKDCTGKEIYEGDIVEFITERYHGTKEIHPKIFRSEVRYIEGGFVITESNEWDTWLCAMTQGKDMLIEVVGNIFENKELLE